MRDASSGQRTGAARWLGKHLSDVELAWLTRQIASLAGGARCALEAGIDRHPGTGRKTPRRAGLVGGTRRRGARRPSPGRRAGLAAQRLSDIYRALVAAGEESGDLSLVMERLATYVEQRSALRGKVMTAFICPAIVGVVSVGMLSFFLLGFVVPQVIGAFNQTHQQLPLITRIMVAMSDIVRDWARRPAAGVAAFAAWRWSLRAPRAAALARTPHCACPWPAAVILEMNAARFASTLAILSGSACRCCAPLQAAAQTLTNERLRARPSPTPPTACARARRSRLPCKPRKPPAAPRSTPDRQRRRTHRRTGAHAGSRRHHLVRRPGAARHGHDRIA